MQERTQLVSVASATESDKRPNRDRHRAVGFRHRPDHELQQLDDEALIAYLHAACSAGEAAASRRALEILVFGHLGNAERRLAIRLPREAVQEAAHDAIVRAIASQFDGSSVGEFRAWLGTIIDRTAVDWYRRRSRRPQETILPSEHQGPDAVNRQEPGVESEAGAVELQIIVDESLAKLSEAHRQVVLLHIFEGVPAGEVCQRVEGMTPDNVAQVVSRFRKLLRTTLQDAGIKVPA